MEWLTRPGFSCCLNPMKAMKGFLVVVGAFTTGVAIYQGLLFAAQQNDIILGGFPGMVLAIIPLFLGYSAIGSAKRYYGANAIEMKPIHKIGFGILIGIGVVGFLLILLTIWLLFASF